MSKSLRMTFSAASGENHNISVNVPKDNLDTQTVRDAMADIVENGAAFEDELTASLKAVLTETNTTVLLDNTAD